MNDSMSEWRDASGRLSFDFDQIDADQYMDTCLKVAGEFGLDADGPPVVGPDQMFWRFSMAGHAVHLDWDIWLSLILSAADSDSEELVRHIRDWLSAELTG